MTDVPDETWTWAVLQRHERRVANSLLMEATHRLRDGETDWAVLRQGLGRNHLPPLLMAVWHTLPTDQRISALGNTWTFAEHPERQFPRRDWLPLFRDVGYIDGDQPATPPERRMLWRGGVKRTRMSWTADRERAVWFQHRYGDGNAGRLWTVTVGAERMLAHFGEHYRKEDEYVIDPTGIRPKAVDERAAGQ